ncbi:MAG: hypothetical protein WD532_04450 [Acidimicrobiia bacterium]
MKVLPPFGIRSDSTMVVVYQGTDPFRHRRLTSDPRRPACGPTREAGVLVTRKRADAAGLMQCPDCWPTPDQFNPSSEQDLQQ